MDCFVWLENTPPSAFMREDFYAYFVALIFHAIGMAFLIGGGIAVSLRTMGVARGAPLYQFSKFFPWMWFGAVLALFSGIALLLGYPAKALTNPVFALKFACFIAAALLTRRISRRYMALSTVGEPVPSEARWVGAGALALWLGGVACGKLLLYTNTILMASNDVPMDF